MSFCQSNPATAQAGSQLVDRSAFLPWATSWYAQPATGPQTSVPALPSAWAGVGNQAVFTPTGAPSLYVDTATGLPTDNGFNTFN
jgi:hypothetical protein